MRRILFTVLFCVSWVFAAQAQEQEIEGTITAQIEAFKADDFASAFQFATPDLQLLFQTPQNFERMVTQGYPMVWRPANVRYLELRTHAGALWQKVMITDGNGVIHILDYKMIETAAGWRIGAVQIVNQGSANA